jgi:glycosyltransferase involved in cell wall biosynthesis
MRKVVVSVTNNLAFDQRVERVCQSLHKWGFNVLLVGRVWPETPSFERPYNCKRIKHFFNRKFLFYAEYNIRLFFYLLFTKADILLANDLDTLPANYLASKIKRCKLIFDSHEYFPETPEVYKREFVRRCWLFLERALIKGCDQYYTVSSSLADIYRHKYGIKFQVIRNVPVLQPEAEFNDSGNVIIYQGSVNIGRGLELVLQAMTLLNNSQLIIAGDGPELKKVKELSASLQLCDRVRFTGNLIPADLRQITKTAAVGISIEEAMGQSYNAALPNKLFDYIQTSVPVLVSDLPEMKAIVEQYQVGMILEERTPECLAAVLNTMLYDVEKRKFWKVKLRVAREELCWDKEELKLRELFE